MKAGVATILVLCTVACAACGAARPSESAFRAKANSICHDLTRKTQLQGSATASGLQATLTNIRTGIGALSKLKPPPRDAATYADFLARLRRLLAFARDVGPRLLSLTQQLEHAMSKRVSTYGARRRTALRFKRLARLIRSLEQPIQRDARLAGRDARALHLPQCAIGASGS